MKKLYSSNIFELLFNTAEVEIVSSNDLLLVSVVAGSHNPGKHTPIRV